MAQTFESLVESGKAPFFLWNKTAGFVGNSPMLWHKSDSGYTQWIDEAKRFSAEQAAKEN